MVTFTPIFNRNNQENKSGLYTVNIRVIIKSVPYFLSPELPRIPKSQWTGKSLRWVSMDNPNHYKFNALLQSELSMLNTWADRMTLERKVITWEKVKEFYSLKGTPMTFNEFAQRYVKKTKFTSYRNWQKYNTFLGHLEEFQENIQFRDLGEPLFHRFRDFLKEGKGHKGSTQDKYFSPFKKIVKDAVKNEYLSSNPFETASLEITINKPKRVSLDVSEIRRFINLVLPEGKEHLIKHRDTFVFQCLSGLYYSDLKALKPDNIVLNENGDQLIKGDRIKGDDPLFIIPIYKLPQAVEILNRYLALGSDFVFPDTVKDPAYNRSLKVLGQLAGISKHITNKVGRHSFTDLMVSKGFPRAFVSKMLGHKKEQTTQIYYEINASHMGKSLEGFEKVVL